MDILMKGEGAEGKQKPPETPPTEARYLNKKQSSIH